jgi:predicted aconitase
MYLTDRDKALLDGIDGEASATAMAALVQLGEAFDAADMVDIGYAHVHPGMALYKGDVELIESLSASGANMRVPVSTNIINADVGNWMQTGAPKTLAALQKRSEAAHRKMGSSGCFTCTPYWAGHWPTWNMHIASIESGVTAFANSVLGARANRDGYFATYAGITGRYPRFGLHLDENRRPTHRIVVDAALDGTTDFTVLGYVIGERVRNGVPFISGLARRPTLDEMDALGVGQATSGGISMFIVPGVTPPYEATAVADAALDEIHVTLADIRDIYDRFSAGDPQDVDLIHLGCPHASYNEMRDYSQLLAGRKLREGIELWVTTSRVVRQMAAESGLLQPILASGAKIITDTCPMSCHFARTVSPDPKLGVEAPRLRTVMVDSAKQAHYVRSMIQCPTLLGTARDVVDFAVTGDYRPRF